MCRAQRHDQRGDASPRARGRTPRDERDLSIARDKRSVASRDPRERASVRERVPLSEISIVLRWGGVGHSSAVRAAAARTTLTFCVRRVLCHSRSLWRTMLGMASVLHDARAARARPTAREVRRREAVRRPAEGVSLARGRSMSPSRWHARARAAVPERSCRPRMLSRAPRPRSLGVRLAAFARGIFSRCGATSHPPRPRPTVCAPLRALRRGVVVVAFGTSGARSTRATARRRAASCSSTPTPPPHPSARRRRPPRRRRRWLRAAMRSGRRRTASCGRSRARCARPRWA